MIIQKPNVQLDGRYSINETAAALEVSRASIGRYVKAGLIRVGYRKTTGRPFVLGRDILRFWSEKI